MCQGGFQIHLLDTQYRQFRWLSSLRKHTWDVEKVKQAYVIYSDVNVIMNFDI